MSEPLYRLGCPVWVCAAWKGTLLEKNAPRSAWLSQYSSVFGTVEGNSTFYALPSAEAVQRWADETHPGFQFALKFPKAISHDKRLNDARNETAAFLSLLEVLQKGDRLGPSFLQLPPTFDRREFPVLKAYLQSLPKEFPYAVEVRHRDYFDLRSIETALDELLTSLGVDRVLFDSRALFSAPASDPAEEEAQRRKPRSPLRFTVTGRRPFARIVGRNDVSLVQPWLQEWADVVAGWISQGFQPLVFAHTPDDQFAPQMAELFHEELRRRVPQLPPLPAWPGRKAAPTERQKTLF
jgi:uncharacterized protein YecE (DUF72 family)